MGRNSRGFLTGITTWWRKKIIAVRHSFYRKRLVRRLTNLAPSILSLDCVGGVMAHDLRLRFNSPTVNLFFESCGDFIDYVADLRYYSQAELCECPYAYEGARRYPVGMLKGNGTLPDIKIHFLHYRSFEEAREKWLERSGRLDFDNLCVVMQAAFGTFRTAADIAQSDPGLRNAAVAKPVDFQDAFAGFFRAGPDLGL